MRNLARRLLACLCLAWLALPLWAADMSALARVDQGRSSFSEDAAGLGLRLALSQPVPWRVFVLADPWRLVVDFNEVDFAGFRSWELGGIPLGGTIRTGHLGPGWSRMVIDLAGPMLLSSAGLETGGAAGAVLTLAAVPAPEAAARAKAGAPPDALFELPAPAESAARKTRQTGDGRLMVVLDPGHGGVDPGAEAGGEVEARLALAFALELEEALKRQGNIDVLLTRRDDSFVPLEARVSIARAAGADVFLSLHADALSEGRAAGATVYTLAEEATDEASRLLAERHDRDDLLAGLDLAGQDDVVAGVLMDLARTETQPRSERLAEAIVAALQASGNRLYKHPHMQAAFSVLKAPDIPSALIELGFLSSDKDRAKLIDPEWRARSVAALVSAIEAWARDDAATAALLRQ